MSFKLDFSSIKIIRIHKEQFDSIDKNAKAIILTCIEDGRNIVFNERIVEK